MHAQEQNHQQVTPGLAPQRRFQLGGGGAAGDLAADEHLVALRDAHEGEHQHRHQEETEQMQGVTAELLIDQDRQQHHRQNDRRGKLVQLAPQHVAEEHRHGAHHHAVGRQRNHLFETGRQRLRERRDACRGGTGELAVDKENKQAEREHLGAGGEQLAGGDAFVERRDHDHQQAGPQHHAHGAGHGGGRQRQLLARADTS